ncbi:hypothetical protein BOX15_Mlig029861g1 [Macrostomum lignano]|uniref:EF-hand domain-containing protein n=1 Tax=Macrostomum lignano TaxID=282301 RepID=A0A267FSI3_9PLAT|nr:hypothetical protein BOX15_Mlig029861g1 [Macrostomum lignano]
MSRPDKQQLLRWFTEIDTEGNGFITFEGLKAVCQRDGLDESSAVEMFEILDANRDGKITKREYMLLLDIYPENEREEETWRLVFESVDEEGTGQTTFAEVERYFATNVGQRVALGVYKNDLRRFHHAVGRSVTTFNTEDFITWFRKERRA